MTLNIKQWKFKSPRRNSKYNSNRVSYQGIAFQSILERDFFIYLLDLKKKGKVACFERQSVLDLPGGIKYKVDFTVFYSNGTIEFIDVKGFETDVFKIKKKLIETVYPFEIKIIKKEDIKFLLNT